MNGKKAKSLRKRAGFVPSAPREYNHATVKTVMVDSGKLDEKGNAIMRPEARITSSDLSHPHVLYKSLKRNS